MSSNAAATIPWAPDAVFGRFVVVNEAVCSLINDIYVPRNRLNNIGV